MKKAVLGLILLVLFITGCRGGSDDSGIVEIRENMFLTQVNDINLNYREYLGRTIKLEGFILRNHWNERDYYFVVRNGPDCCGNDGEIGFEISWNPDNDGSGQPMDQRNSFPDVDEWVQAVGVLNSYDFMGQPFLFLTLSELNVLETRGLEHVIR